jgi:hypothetical protein
MSGILVSFFSLDASDEAVEQRRSLGLSAFSGVVALLGEGG